MDKPFVEEATQTWIAADEPAPYEVVNGEGRGRVILTCDHASDRIPRRLGTLGVSWDPLAPLPKAPFVAPQYLLHTVEHVRRHQSLVLSGGQFWTLWLGAKIGINEFTVRYFPQINPTLEYLIDAPPGFLLIGEAGIEPPLNLPKRVPAGGVHLKHLRYQFRFAWLRHKKHHHVFGIIETRTVIAVDD